MLQFLNVNPPNVNQNYPCVSGYALALSKATPAERAFTAAGLVLGWVHLIDPRVTPAARLARAPRSMSMPRSQFCDMVIAISKPQFGPTRSPCSKPPS